MNEGPLKTPVPGGAPVEQGAGGQSTQKISGKAEWTSEPTPALEPRAASNSVAAQELPGSEDADEAAKAAGFEPPVDWFEPLEDDDNDEESLAGESERSESLAGSEKLFKKIYKFPMPRRKRSHPDEGWDEWSILGEGWKRKEVVRRSGSSIGQKDVYYLSPRGERVRSRVELISLMEGQLDLSTFEYKSGKFYNGEAPPVRIRHRTKRKVRERSSSESSWMERGDGADTPDSHHTSTPSLGPKNLQTSLSLNSAVGTLNKDSRDEDPPAGETNKLPLPSSSRPLPSINGEVGSEDGTLICARCGISFTGTWYDKQRKKPCCPNCWAASKSKEHPMVRFRKWIPCGQCLGCNNTINCGLCANCKHGMQSPESRKRLCRKRKCICPIRKGPGSAAFLPQKPYNDIPDMYEDSLSFQSEFADSQHPSLKSSDTENFSVNVDVDVDDDDDDDDDDMSTDDDDDWHKKRKRRACGECKACLCRKDCGTCDFCGDKPKFGGSNKKRQKCRLRQCQRQAMRHLLPSQKRHSDHGPDGQFLPGRPRPHYKSSRKYALDFTDNEDDDCNIKPINWTTASASGSTYLYGLDVKNQPPSTQLDSMDLQLPNGLPDGVPHISGNHNNSKLDGQKHAEEMAEDDDSDEDDEDYEEEEEEEEEEDDDDDEEEEEEELPMITQIFSLAENPPVGGADIENQLMTLLQSLRSSAMPILWYAIMVEGPQLQLIQCSKQSSLSDAIVLIDPGFCYQVTVQKQPLLPTHPLYDRYPARLTSVTEVVGLLLGLEDYVVCQGLPPKEPLSDTNLIILERASTCDFLVNKKVSVCPNCRALRGL
ncbi:methyl-CpG-binding domain protein 1b [Pseudoliparis swirei]|uniref:methyl-CpG-binding domain protein 1b n=1 Tax=Pseudoliparis swirei TaxID=2059687 RepID=UPI0024BE9E63|nr:methyl-CpG-binding domain protein 1b [Pseudoliparis swirei]